MASNENLKSFLENAISNNTFDFETLHNSLQLAWNRSYHHLKDKQDSEVPFKYFHYESNDIDSRKNEIGHLHLDNYYRPVFTVSHDLIYHMDTDAYRLSDFYQKYINFYDLAYCPDIFKYVPIIIVDNVVYWDFDIKIFDDYFEVRLNLPRNSFVIKSERKEDTTLDYWNSEIYENHSIDVLVVENSLFARYNVGTVSNTFTVQKAELQNFANNIQSYKDRKAYFESHGLINTEDFTEYQRIENLLRDTDVVLRGEKTIPTDGTMMCSFSEIDALGNVIRTNVGPNPELETSEKYNWGSDSMLIPMIYTNDSFQVTVPSRFRGKRVRIYMFFFKNLYRKTIPLGDGVTPFSLFSRRLEYNYFVLNKKDGNEYIDYDCPIPLSNLLIYQLSDPYEYEKINNSIRIEEHYFNLFNFNTEDLNNNYYKYFEVYYFYKETDEPLKHINVFKYQLKAIELFFAKYIDSSTQKYKYYEVIMNDILLNHFNTSLANRISNSSGEEHTEWRQELIDIFNSMLQYMPENLDYSTHGISSHADNDGALLYADELMRDFVKQDVKILSDYVKMQRDKEGPYSYRLYTKNINLDERRRINAINEINIFEGDFPEERYVFGFSNESDYPELLDARIYVDGLLITDVIYRRGYFTDYFYIKTTDVTSDSYIEITFNPRYEYKSEVIQFNSISDSFTIDIPESEIGIMPTQADIIIEGKDENDEYCRFDPNLFDFVIDADDLGKWTGHNIEDIQVELSSITDKDFFPSADRPSLHFANIKTIEVKLKTDGSINYDNLGIYGKDLTIKICKRPIFLRFWVTRQGWAYIDFPNGNFNYNKDYIRVYYNGKLLPRTRYNMVTTFNHPRLVILQWMQPSDMVYVDITPYKYNQVFQKEYIPDEESFQADDGILDYHADERYFRQGLDDQRPAKYFKYFSVDLSNHINKPFDLKYYDVYVNGRKLGYNNVYKVGAFNIVLTNLKSNYNITIFERERDYDEFYGININDIMNVDYYPLDKMINDGYLIGRDVYYNLVEYMIGEQCDPEEVENIPLYYPNNIILDDVISTEEVDYKHMEIFMYYYDELIPKQYYNPDLKQSNEKIVKDMFHDIYDAYITQNSENEDVLLLDPDVVIDSMSNVIREDLNTGTERPVDAFMIGHQQDEFSESNYREFISEERFNYYSNTHHPNGVNTVKQTYERSYSDGN